MSLLFFFEKNANYFAIIEGIYKVFSNIYKKVGKSGVKWLKVEQNHYKVYRGVQKCLLVNINMP